MGPTRAHSAFRAADFRAHRNIAARTTRPGKYCGTQDFAHPLLEQTG